MIQLKKPKFWDKEKPNYLSFILLPISKIVEQVGKLLSKKRAKINGIKSICIGNIYRRYRQNFFSNRIEKILRSAEY